MTTDRLWWQQQQWVIMGETTKMTGELLLQRQWFFCTDSYYSSFNRLLQQHQGSATRKVQRQRAQPPSPSSVGEVWFGSVWGTFFQTGNQTVWFFSDFQKPKPKPHQTIWCGFKWFQTQFKPKPFKKKIICNSLLHNFVVYLLQIYLIYIKLHIDGCPEEKR